MKMRALFCEMGGSRRALVQKPGDEYCPGSKNFNGSGGNTMRNQRASSKKGSSATQRGGAGWRQGVVLSAFFALIAAACSGPAGGDGGASPSSPADTGTVTNTETESPVAAEAPDCSGETLTIGMSSASFIYFPFFVTLGSGFLEETGLEVDPIELEGGGAETVAATVGGSLDVSISTFTTVMSAVSEGAPLRAIAPAEIKNGLVVVARASLMEEAGITPDSSPEEKIEFLRGKSIGVSSPGSGTDTLIRYLLASGELNPDSDATITPLGGTSAMVSAFVSDQIDVFAATPPGVYVAAEEGDGEFLFYGPRGDIPGQEEFLFTSFNAGTQTIANRPEVLRCFLHGLNRGLNLIHTDPEAAAEAARPFYEESLAEAGGPELYLQIVRDYQPSFPESVVISENLVESAISLVNAFGERSVDADPSELFNSELAADVEQVEPQDG